MQKLEEPKSMLKRELRRPRHEQQIAMLLPVKQAVSRSQHATCPTGIVTFAVRTLLIVG